MWCGKSGEEKKKWEIWGRKKEVGNLRIIYSEGVKIFSLDEDEPGSERDFLNEESFLCYDGEGGAAGY